MNKKTHNPLNEMKRRRENEREEGTERTKRKHHLCLFFEFRFEFQNEKKNGEQREERRVDDERSQKHLSPPCAT